jgi:phytoene dehydrogenase-like protein
MSARLAECIEAAGSHVRVGSQVQGITVSGGGVRGVVVSHNSHGIRTVRAPLVISNADVKLTVDELVGREHFPEAFVSKIRRFEMAAPLFSVYLGLSMPATDLPGSSGSMWLVTDLDQDAEYELIRRGEMSDHPGVFVSAGTLKDTGRSSNGHTTLEVLALAPSQPSFWGVSEEQVRAWTYSCEPAYRSVKQRIQELCIDQAAQLIPGLRDSIIYAGSASPLTHTRFVGSTGGTGYGFAALPDQPHHQRPGAKSPIAGLKFCGANCQSWHGIIGAAVSGLRVAEEVLGARLLV